MFNCDYPLVSEVPENEEIVWVGEECVGLRLRSDEILLLSARVQTLRTTTN